MLIRKLCLVAWNSLGFRFFIRGIALGLTITIALNIWVNNAFGQFEVPENFKVTLERPGTILVNIPKAISQHDSTAIELTTLSVLPDEGEQFIVEVYFTGESKLRNEVLPKDRLLGTYGFYPPAKDGEIRKFLIPFSSDLAEQLEDKTKPMNLIVRLMNYDSKTSDSNSSLSILDAKVITSID